MKTVTRPGRRASGKKQRGVYERPKGSNVWWILYYDQYGQRHREKVGPKGLAIAAYQKRKTDIREGKFLPGKVTQRQQAVLFKTMLDDYLEYSRANKRSYKTDLAEAVRIRREFGAKPLDAITAHDIERFKAKLLEELAPATVNLHLALIKHLYTKAIEWKKTAANPARSVKFLRRNNARVRYMSEEEELRLHAVFPPAHWDKVVLAFSTGMRRAEQFGLQWTSVNFQAGVLTIPLTKQGEARHIPINDRAMEILRTLPSRMKSAYVFPSKTNQTPLNANNFANRVWVPVVAQARIENLHWHDLRHTFASRLVMAGVDLRTVQELMGHKDIKMTLRYTHLSPSHKMAAVQRLNASPTATTTATRQDKAVV